MDTDTDDLTLSSNLEAKASQGGNACFDQTINSTIWVVGHRPKPYKDREWIYKT